MMGVSAGWLPPRAGFCDGLLPSPIYFIDSLRTVIESM